MTFNVSKTSRQLSVLTYSMPHMQSVAISITVKTGSRYETIEEEGISHFLEHMAFKGTANRTAKQIAEEFDEIGGHCNAYTSKEQTVYYAKVLRHNLAKAIDILADILQNSLFDEVDIAKEYDVIAQEIAQVLDNPDDLVYEKFYQTAYAGCELGKSILGEKENLASFTPNSFKSYLTKHYRTQNIFLSVAGNIEHTEIVELAETKFNLLPLGMGEKFNPAIYSGGTNLVKKDLEQSVLVIGFQSVPYIQITDYYNTQLLALILGGGISSRLFQEIRENLGLAYSIGAYNSSYFDSGIFSIYGATSHEKLTKLMSAINGEIQKITEGITELELIRAKEQVRSAVYMAEEKTGYKAEEIAKNYAIFNKYLSPIEIVDKIMSTTAVDINNAANRIFAGKPTIAAIGPKVEILHKLT